MTWMPFVCLAMGFLIGTVSKEERFLKGADHVATIAIAMLMLSIGLGIGMDQAIFDELLKIGFQCLVISCCAISCSVALVVLCEKTVLPLKKVDEELGKKNLELRQGSGQEENQDSLLVWLMPACIIAGLLAGAVLRIHIAYAFVDKSITVFLIVLYICVGISQGANKEVYRFICLLGLKILFLPAAILVGSILGGYIAGVLLGVPCHISVISAGGMSYYSITGAFMTEAYGLEVGAYGFLVNVMREFLTVLFMPILVKISKGSPIAGGAAGNMDTMLAPVTKFVGVRLGLVTLVTGTVLTFVVPFLLPLMAAVG